MGRLNQQRKLFNVYQSTQTPDVMGSGVVTEQISKQVARMTLKPHGDTKVEEHEPTQQMVDIHTDSDTLPGEKLKAKLLRKIEREKKKKHTDMEGGFIFALIAAITAAASTAAATTIVGGVTVGTLAGSALTGAAGAFGAWAVNKMAGKGATDVDKLKSAVSKMAQKVKITADDMRNSDKIKAAYDKYLQSAQTKQDKIDFAKIAAPIALEATQNKLAQSIEQKVGEAVNVIDGTDERAFKNSFVSNLIKQM